MRKSKGKIRDEAAQAISLTMKRLMTSARLLLEAELESDGMTLAQLRMLNALDKETEISSAELSRLCYVTPQSMQTLMTRAEREGWVRRSPSPGNRRILTARLTPRGRRAFERGKEIWTAISREIWQETRLSEMEDMNRVLSHAVDRLQPLLDDLHSRHAERRRMARTNALIFSQPS